MNQSTEPESDYDRDRLLNELRMQRELLKAQGEELREARRELAELRDRHDALLLSGAAPGPAPQGGATEKDQGDGEKRYRLLFESLQEVVFLHELVTDGEGHPVELRVLDANRAALKLLGLPREGVIGRCLGEIFPEMEPALLSAALNTALTGELTALGELRGATGRWLQSYAYSPQPRQVALVSLDITERKLMEIALQKSESSLAEAQHIARIGAWEWDMRSGEGRWSAELYAICGLDPIAYTPSIHSFVRYVHPDDTQMVQKMIEQSASEGGAVNFDFRIRRGDGSTRILNCVGEVAAYDDDGRPRLMVGINQDITERKRVEEALVESRRLYKLLADSTPDLVVMYDQAGRPTYVNSTWLRYTSHTLQHLQQHGCGALHHPDELPRLAKAWRAALQGGTPYEEEFRYRRHDGSYRWFWSRAVPVRDGSGSIGSWVAISTDITEQKQSREAQILSAKRDERAKSLKTIQEYQNRLSQLASKLSLAQEEERRRIAVEVHDSIGQNLAFCKLKVGRLQLAHSEAAPGLGEVLETLDRCITASRSLSFELSPAVLFDLGLEPALQWLARLHAARHGLKIAVLGQSGRDLALPSRILLFQAAREFLANVVKHSGASRAEIRLSAARKSVTLTVRDDGAGFLLPATGTVPDESSGFGLFSVQEQLRNAGGSLEIDSAPGAGTTARATLPLASPSRRRKSWA